MYYRYKAKKKDRRFIKTIVVIILITAGLYFAYSNRTQLMFWKITRNRITTDIDRVVNIEDRNKKIRELDRLVESLGIYKEENPFDPDAYVMSARVNFFKAMSESGKSFTEMYVYDSFKDVPGSVKKQLLVSIRDFNKAKALLEGKLLNPPDVVMLGKALFLNKYYEPEEIYQRLSSIKPERDIELDDIRFYVIIATLSGNFEEGLSVAEKYGQIDDTVEGKLFYASLLKDASRYTEAIMEFRKISGESSDTVVLKAAHFNLGRIYYKQRLYRESLEQFESILAMDNDDLNSKIWLGRSYSAMGNRDRAKAIWGEVLTVNSSNQEVKKLLGLM
jgi:tetratricopeptide (TPR) repeat protein